MGARRGPQKRLCPNQIDHDYTNPLSGYDFLKYRKKDRVEAQISAPGRLTKVDRLYTPLIRAALADWHQEVLYLSLDTILGRALLDLTGRCASRSGLTRGVASAGHSRNSISFSDYREMLYHATEHLPKSIKIVLLADRGFVHRDRISSVVRSLQELA